jgi:acetoin utilization deacetylase AcuC-like enzyme
MSRLEVVEQRRGSGDAALWVREGDRRVPGRDSNLRLLALDAGLARHAGIHRVGAGVPDEELDRTLSGLHDSDYLTALAAIDTEDPVVMPQFAPPGLEPDIPVSAPLIAAAREGVRTSISAAEQLLGGAPYAYALCRPPGHHAGPGFHAGYCYLNNAAAAARRLCDGGLDPVGILDLDLHYPNGTSALIERIDGTTLHSLHASPVTNLPPGATLPRVEGERAVTFAAPPSAGAYLREVRASVAALAETASALVVSLGFDTVAGDPHGGWDFEPEIFADVGAILAGSGLPVCTIQEGGYALSSLAACSHAFATGLLGGGGR